MNLSIFVSSISQGLLWAIMAIGVYLTFRILDIADMTAEGSFPLGGALTAMAITSGTNPVVATLYGFCGGALAGLVSGILHTKFKIPDLLTGILTMTGLYSVNLLIMGGKANISLLLNVKTVFNLVDLGDPTLDTIVVGVVVLAIVIGLVVGFFHTQMGLAARAVGDNQAMSAANGINNDNMKIIVYMISNGLIALAGSLLAQNDGYTDVSKGIGTLVIALSAIIMAEVAIHNLSFGWRLATIVVGAVVYRWLIAIVLWLGVDPNLLRLLYATMLVIFLALAPVQKALKNAAQRRENKKEMGED